MSTLSIHSCSLLFAASFVSVVTLNAPPAAAQVECCEVSADPNTATIPQPGELLGSSVAVDGGTAVAGAPLFDFMIGEEVFLDGGRAIVFSFTGSSWVQIAVLNAGIDQGAFDGFGLSVALDGDFAVIGAPHNDDDGESSGSAYIFDRNAGWGQVKKLTAGNDADTNDLFGVSVAIRGDTVVIGAYGNIHSGLDRPGSAYVFQRTQGGPNMWGKVTRLDASDAADSVRFGFSVSIDTGVIVIGSPKYDMLPPGNEGKAYVFRFNGLSWPIGIMRLRST